MPGFNILVSGLTKRSNDSELLGCANETQTDESPVGWVDHCVKVSMVEIYEREPVARLYASCIGLGVSWQNSGNLRICKWLTNIMIDIVQYLLNCYFKWFPLLLPDAMNGYNPEACLEIIPDKLFCIPRVLFDEPMGLHLSCTVVYSSIGLLCFVSWLFLSWVQSWSIYCIVLGSLALCTLYG